MALLSQSQPVRSACSPRGINPPLECIPGLTLTRAPSRVSLLHKALRRESAKNRQRCLHGNRQPGGPLCPILPLFPWPVFSSSSSLQHLQLESKSEPKACICLRPASASFPRTRAPQGRGQKDRPGGKTTEKLELTMPGPELGVSGTAPISSILSNCLTTGQNLWADFYFRKKGEMKSLVGW